MKQKEFRKKSEDLTEEFIRKMNHHFTRLMCKFMNDTWKLQEEFDKK